jgi:hypothetical protein
VGWLIRSATQPVFHKGNSLQKEKEKRTKKEKEKGLMENAAAMEIRKESVAFGSFFLMRIPTAAWKSLATNAQLFHISHKARLRNTLW